MLGIKKPLSAATEKGSDSSSSSDDSNVLDSRLSRYYTAKKRAQVNRDELRVQASLCDPGTPNFQKYAKAASNIASCGNYLVFNDYYTVGITRLSKASFCKQHLLCPLCAIRRASKTLKSYLGRYSVIMEENPYYRLSMITLTVKNGEDLQERFEHLKKSQTRLFDRRRDWLKKGWGKTEFRKIHGWVGTYEFTNKGKGWHPHSHIMVLHTENFNYSALIEEWKQVTGDSCNINVTAIKATPAPARTHVHTRTSPFLHTTESELSTNERSTSQCTSGVTTPALPSTDERSTSQCTSGVTTPALPSTNERSTSQCTSGVVTDAFIEVFKYALKFSDLTAEQNIHAWEVLKGKRLLFSGGVFRGVEVSEELTDDLFDDLDYIERFYVADRSGYNLEFVQHRTAENLIIQDSEVSENLMKCKDTTTKLNSKKLVRLPLTASERVQRMSAAKGVARRLGIEDIGTMMNARGGITTSTK